MSTASESSAATVFPAWIERAHLRELDAVDLLQAGQAERGWSGQSAARQA